MGRITAKQDVDSTRNQALATMEAETAKLFARHNRVAEGFEHEIRKSGD